MSLKRELERRKDLYVLTRWRKLTEKCRKGAERASKKREKAVGKSAHKDYVYMVMKQGQKQAVELYKEKWGIE